MILAGDIGGTKTNLAFFTAGLKVIVQDRYPSHEHSSLTEIVNLFVADKKIHPEFACFAIAGPVREGICKATNLPWIVDARALEAELGIPKVHLINDLEANAYGIAALGPQDLVTLNAGKPCAGNAAVISAGTGLGEAGLYWNGKEHLPFACEGGHTDFAPRNEMEIDLLLYLSKEFGHVSYERMLSGPGIYNLYRFLRDSGRGREAPWFAEEAQKTDPTILVCNAALANRCSLCVQTVQLFVMLYGAEAGNWALKMMAYGGVYLGGGIAPRLLSFLNQGSFVENFVAKGRFEWLLKDIPVQVITNDKTALLGAGLCALRG